MQSPTMQSNGKFDILISTDVMAEGVNLQQCRHIINFDMPWNPMRLVQRHGRIDRINSPHSCVYLRTIFPVDRLDELLSLVERILTKIAFAAKSVGISTPIERGEQGQQVFTETREEINKLLNEDSTIFEQGGSAGAAQTGEEYRQTLRNEIKENGDYIQHLPWKIGSGMVKGSNRGMFFCAVVGSESEYERTYLRFVSGSKDWMPEIKEPSEDKHQTEFKVERELGICLRLIECTDCTQLWHPSWLQEKVYDFWEVARQDIFRDWEYYTDPINLQPPVRPLNRQVTDFIQDNFPHGEKQERIEKAQDILASPWPRREEMILRELFESKEKNGSKLSELLVNWILKTGLEPTFSPPPLPPIQMDDIKLLCWMGIESDLAN